jgi:short-subunit dehydrogenase
VTVRARPALCSPPVTQPTPNAAPTSQRPIALITGASAGLGREFARLCAKDGMDLILVARSEAPLKELGKELEAAHGTRSTVLPADLADPKSSDHIFDETKRLGLVVEVLINNAGFGSAGPFLDLPLAGEIGMVEVNINAVLRLSHRFGQGMAERGRGRILNIASTAGFQAGPFMATYYASKAFVITFSEALAHELRPRGVTVTCHCPGATATSFAERAGNQSSKLFQRSGVAAAPEVAAHAYAAMKKGQVLSIHGTTNKIGAFLTRFSPRSINASIAASLNQK